MSATNSERCRVFIVDNNADLAWSLSEVLALESDFDAVGYCCTGVDALLQARRVNTDVLILDFRLTDRTALTVLDEARETAAPFGILIYSGYMADELVAEAMTRGAAGYLPKGGSVEALAGEIRRIHQLRRSSSG